MSIACYTVKPTPTITLSCADPIDTSVYELHVREFSASDDSVPEHIRGKYVAFDTSATGTVSRGQQHLKDLAAAGLTHVHLLPSYDFGSVPEKAEDQLDVALHLSQFAPGVLACSSYTLLYKRTDTLILVACIIQALANRLLRCWFCSC